MADGAFGAREVRARRAHVCDLCGTTIAPGTLYTAWAVAWEGSVGTCRAHRSCSAIFDRITRIDGHAYDEWSEPPVREWARDVYDELHVDPPYLDVVDLADEWRAVWAAMRGEVQHG